MKGVKKFKVNLKGLSKEEQRCFKKLVLAAELLGAPYLRQKNSKYPGADFYPSNATKEEIQKAAKNNPAILNPYTFVERDKSRKLVAVPYRVKFKKDLEKISKYLKEATLVCQDKKLKAYLKARAADLLSDNYDKSNILWLKTEKSKIGCVIGPFDRYLDKLFFRKRAYMAWIGVLDKKQTEEAEKLKTIVLTSERKYLPGAKKARIPQVKVRVEDAAVFSGLIADFMFVGNNLPSSADLHLIKKHGTLLTVFNPTVKLRFEQWIYPIYKAVFGKNFQEKYSREELYKAFFRSIVLHETCHSLMRYEDATVRLQELFPFFDELYTDILAVKCCGSLLLKDAISQKELEAYLIIYICRHLHWMTSYSKKPHLAAYATGGAISLNFIFGGNALIKSGNAFRIDFQKLFIALDQLSHIIEYYMALGKYDEAKDFIKKDSSFRDFQRYFFPRLEKLLKK